MSELGKGFATPASPGEDCLPLTQVVRIVGSTEANCRFQNRRISSFERPSLLQGPPLFANRKLQVLPILVDHAVWQQEWYFEHSFLKNRWNDE